MDPRLWSPAATATGDLWGVVFFTISAAGGAPEASLVLGCQGRLRLRPLQVKEV